MIDFACPRCGMTYQAKEELAGRQTKCGKCAGVLVVPTTSQLRTAGFREAPDCIPDSTRTPFLRRLAVLQLRDYLRPPLLFACLGGAGLVLVIFITVLSLTHRRELNEDTSLNDLQNKAINQPGRTNENTNPEASPEPFKHEWLKQNQSQLIEEKASQKQTVEEKGREHRLAGKSGDGSERDRLLDELEKSERVALAAMDLQLTDLRKQLSDATKQQRAIEKALGVKQQNVGGVIIESQEVDALSPKGRKLEEERERLEKEVSKLKSASSRLQQEREAKKEQFEQDRRRILVKYPAANDPQFTEYKGKLYTTDELVKVKKFEEEHGTPKDAADFYIAELIRTAVIEKAEYTRTSAEAVPLEAVRDKEKVKVWRTVHYRVRYVSKGGFVNDRELYVSVLQLQDGYWYVSPLMKQLEILGGIRK
jgi:hypothetical protein